MSNIKVSMDTARMLEKIEAMPQTYSAISKAYVELSNMSSMYVAQYTGESSLEYNELVDTVDSDVNALLNTLTNLNAAIMGEVEKNTSIDNVSDKRASVLKGLRDTAQNSLKTLEPQVLKSAPENKSLENVKGFTVEMD